MFILHSAPPFQWTVCWKVFLGFCLHDCFLNLLMLEKYPEKTLGIQNIISNLRNIPRVNDFSNILKRSMSIIHNFFVLPCSSTKFLFLHEHGISMLFNLILFISSGIPFLFPSQFHSRIFAHKGHWRALAMKKNCPYTHGAPDRWFFLLILSRLDIQALLLSWLHQLFQFTPGSHDSSHYLGCSLPNFDSKLGWFSRQVLFEW